MTARTKEKYEQLKKLVAQGKTAQEACKELHFSPTTYGQCKKLELSQRKKLSKNTITVTELPEPIAAKASGFLVFGSPRVLAEFARAYS